MKQFSIIIPTLNEAANIRTLLLRISDMAQVFNYFPEIIFVDDGSSDDTCKLITSYRGRYEVRLLQRYKKRGLASAVIYGAHHARFNDIVVMDADLSHEPESIPELISPLLSDKYDMVIGSRYVEDGCIHGWPVIRRIGSKIASLPAHFLTGAEDPLSGFFSIKRELLTTVSSIKGFKIGFELLRKHLHHLRIKEVPIHFTDRQGGSSKMNSRVIADYAHQLLQWFGIYLRSTEYKIIVLLGCFFAFIDGQIFLWLTAKNIEKTSAHIASLIFTGHLMYLYVLRRVLKEKQFEQKPPLISIYLHLVLFLLAGMFLRGGLLSAMLKYGTSLEAISWLMGIFTFIIWHIFIATARRKEPVEKISRGAVISAIIVYSLLLRAVYLGTTELMQEEAYYWNYAQHLAIGYLDHPPVTALFIWLGTKILGNTETGIRIGAYLCWFLTAHFSYMLCLRMYSAREAIYAVLFIAILPIFFGASLVMTPDAPLLACWSATLYFLYEALINKRSKFWAGAGISLGIGLSTKYTIVLLGPAVFLFLLVDRSSRKLLRTPLPYIGLAIALLIFSPVLWWNFQNNWASFLFQSHTRITDESMFATHKLFFSLLILLTPAGVITAGLALLPWNLQRSQKNWNHLKISQTYLFTLCMTLIPFLVFFFFSLSKEVKLNWTGPIWLATVPFMAHGLLACLENSARVPKSLRLLSGSWSKTSVSLILVYGLCLHYLSIGLPGIPYIQNNILLGWDDLARKVSKKSENFELSNGRKPIVVGMDKYRIASGIAFYRNRSREPAQIDSLPLTTGRHLFGLESLMFSYWHPSMLFSHQDLLVVAHSRNWLHPDYFRNRAMQVGKINAFSIEKQGKEVATYYYRLLRGYVPAAPANLTLQTRQN